jgi:hypothetical protein
MTPSGVIVGTSVEAIPVLLPHYKGDNSTARLAGRGELIEPSGGKRPRGLAAIRPIGHLSFTKTLRSGNANSW